MELFKNKPSIKQFLISSSDNDATAQIGPVENMTAVITGVGAYWLYRPPSGSLSEHAAASTGTPERSSELMYDAIIVGARCAGSPVAIHLARKGYRILLVDKTSFPKDTLSTHFVWPRGASYLNRLNILDKVLEVTPSYTTLSLNLEYVSLCGETPLPIVQKRFMSLHGDDDKVVNTFFSARRLVLDNILVDAAVEAGVEFREGVSVEELVFDGDRVVGIRGSTPSGQTIHEKARIVIGADGVNSVVARETKTKNKEIRTACTFACYSYFSGFELDIPVLQKRGRLGCGVIKTNDGLNMVLAYGPKEWFSAFQAKREENFYKALSYVNPELGELVRTKGQREASFYQTDRQTAFIRQPVGPGYMLLGDAASFKDQCTASGMTHAFRDAELAAGAIHQGFAGEKSLDEALTEYAHNRYVDYWRYYRFVLGQAEMHPVQASELQLLEAIQRSQADTNRFIAMFGDALPVDSFYAQENVRGILASTQAERKDYSAYQEQLYQYYKNIFLEGEHNYREYLALAKTSADFAQPVGPDLIARTEHYYRWQQMRAETGTWQYSRTLKAFPGPSSRIVDERGRSIEGVNFASQDYLALNAHPAIVEAVERTIREFGVHSAGSPMIIGNTAISRELEQELADFLRMEHVVLFPTGWAAGFGSIIGLVRPQDHIVMDRLSHACLHQGAYAATLHSDRVRRPSHLDVDAVRAYLKDIRRKDQRNGILVITEGLFSMDSDVPDLAAMQEVCREYEATLFVDVAHDLGAMGPGGTGQIGAQNMLGKIDLVMGSFSKTFASNGGFLATNSAAVKQYIKMYAGSHMFSNALSPVQSAVVLAALRIVRSEEGQMLRENLFQIVNYLRGELANSGLTCLGQPSAIVPVFIGDDGVGRIAHQRLMAKNVAAMMVEYPAVAIGNARFRLQVMASHTQQQAAVAAGAIVESIAEARGYMKDLGLYSERRSVA